MQSPAPSGGLGLVPFDALQNAPIPGSLSLGCDGSSINHAARHDPGPSTPLNEPDPSHGHQQQQQRQELEHFIQVPQRRFRDLQNAARHIITAIDTITRARDDAMRLRDQSLYDRKEYLHQHSFMFDSQSALTTQLSQLNPTHAPLDTLVLERQKLEHDFEALRRHDRAFRLTDDAALRAEYDLRVRETSLADELSDLLNLLRDSDLAPVGTAPALPAHSIPAPTPEIPLCLELYYEKVGAVGWKTDRIDDLQHDYERERTSRTFRQDQGEHLDTSDGDFEADWARRLSEAIQARHIAVEESIKARQECLDYGIDPDKHRQHGLEHHLASQSHHGDQSSIDPPDVFALPSPRPPSEYKGQPPNVADWIAQTNTDSIYPLDVVSFEEVPSLRPLMSPRRSTHDLRQEPRIEWPAKQNHVPNGFRIPPEPERVASEPILYGRHPRGWEDLNLRRTPSDPGMRCTYLHGGLGQNTSFRRVSRVPEEMPHGKAYRPP